MRTTEALFLVAATLIGVSMFFLPHPAPPTPAPLPPPPAPIPPGPIPPGPPPATSTATTITTTTTTSKPARPPGPPPVPNTTTTAAATRNVTQRTTAPGTLSPTRAATPGPPANSVYFGCLSGNLRSSTVNTATGKPHGATLDPSYIGMSNIMYYDKWWQDATGNYTINVTATGYCNAGTTQGFNTYGTAWQFLGGTTFNPQSATYTYAMMYPQCPYMWSGDNQKDSYKLTSSTIGLSGRLQINTFANSQFDYIGGTNLNGADNDYGTNVFYDCLVSNLTFMPGNPGPQVTMEDQCNEVINCVNGDPPGSTITPANVQDWVTKGAACCQQINVPKFNISLPGFVRSVNCLQLWGVQLSSCSMNSVWNVPVCSQGYAPCLGGHNDDPPIPSQEYTVTATATMIAPGAQRGQFIHPRPGHSNSQFGRQNHIHRAVPIPAPPPTFQRLSSFIFALGPAYLRLP